MATITLNCDMGESFGSWSMGNDEAIMPHIDMANIACGFHASDPSTMAKTVALATKHHVSIGAHPSYPDLQGFGRRHMQFSPDEITHMVLYQVGALHSICQAHQTTVDYVKPHGALYHAMMKDLSVRQAVLKAVASLSTLSPQKNIPLMVLANSDSENFKQQAQAYNVPLLFEAFCDRAYNEDGHLASRTIKGAVLETDEAIEKQIKQIITQQQVTTLSNTNIAIHADTLCVHGDHSHALESVKKIKTFIQQLRSH